MQDKLICWHQHWGNWLGVLGPVNQYSYIDQGEQHLGSVHGVPQKLDLDLMAVAQRHKYDDEVLLNVLRCQLTYYGQVVTNAKARFNKSLRPRKPEGSLGQTAQDVHLDCHTVPELW